MSSSIYQAFQMEARVQEKSDGTNQCAREKFWKELSIEEKIERMRGEVNRHERQVVELMHENYRLRRLVRHHEHNNLGRAMITADMDDGGACADQIHHRSTSGDPDEVYF